MKKELKTNEDEIYKVKQRDLEKDKDIDKLKQNISEKQTDIKKLKDSNEENAALIKLIQEELKVKRGKQNIKRKRPGERTRD